VHAELAAVQEQLAAVEQEQINTATRINTLNEQRTRLLDAAEQRHADQAKMAAERAALATRAAAKVEQAAAARADANDKRREIASLEAERGTDLESQLDADDAAELRGLAKRIQALHARVVPSVVELGAVRLVSSVGVLLKTFRR
jgi:phage I-like protein